MDYTATFAISASGMRAEKLRLDVVALNLANLSSTAAPGTQPFKPLFVRTQAADFATTFQRQAGYAAPRGVHVVGVEATDAAPRIVYEPGNPAADANGMVAQPGVNKVTEMATMAAALRSYQANVSAFNATKTIALKTLELGAQ